MLSDDEVVVMCGGDAADSDASDCSGDSGVVFNEISVPLVRC